MEKFTGFCVRDASTLIEAQGGFPDGWTIDSLNNVHSIVSGILHENGDRIDSKWSVTFAELCRIIQQERAQTKYEQDYAYYKKMEALNKK
jgi:hypothetical protein